MRFIALQPTGAENPPVLPPPWHVERQLPVQGRFRRFSTARGRHYLVIQRPLQDLPAVSQFRVSLGSTPLSRDCGAGSLSFVHSPRDRTKNPVSTAYRIDADRTEIDHPSRCLLGNALNKSILNRVCGLWKSNWSLSKVMRNRYNNLGLGEKTHCRSVVELHCLLIVELFRVRDRDAL